MESTIEVKTFLLLDNTIIIIMTIVMAHTYLLNQPPTLQGTKE